MTTTEIIKKYGKPSENGTPYLIKIKLPYPMILAWDRNVKVSSIRCHKLIADKLINVFNDILNEYGFSKIQELGINIFGGCFNYRKMRGGNDWSKHSWGIAIDLYPERNKLKETKRTARFAKDEYKPMIDIFYKHGFISLGVEKDYDWMHFEISQ